MKKLKRVWSVLTKEGLKTFFYLVKTNLQARQSEESKYKQWRKVHEHQQGDIIPVDRQPFFSVIMTGKEGKDRTMSSIQQQNYENCEVICAEEKDTFANLLDKAKGEYIGFVSSGDCLAKEALLRLASVTNCQWNQGRWLYYSDEDIITEAGKRTNPFFKPDYSPDTLRSFFYMGGLLVMKKELATKLVYCMDKPIEYAGYLIALEASFVLKEEQVYHVPEVLYHRSENIRKTDVTVLGQHKEQLFRLYGVEIETEAVEDCGEVRVVYRMKTFPKVSIIIPSKDNPSMLKICLDSIAAYTDYVDYEIVLIDNGSKEENKKAYEKLCGKQKVPCRYYYEPMEFNFSKMCNIGADQAQGQYYLFLNDDIEIRKTQGADWLTRLMGQAMQPHTGAVGAKLLYPNTNRIQHIGVVNYESGAAHILSKAEDDMPRLFGRNRMDYNYSIVTGACFLIKQEKFHEAGGFAGNLAVTFNDVELCFRLLKKGYYNVVRNDVVLYHHESISRGEDALDSKKFLRHLKEREKLFAMHREYVKRDRFYSYNLTQTELDGAPNIEKRPKDFRTWVVPAKKEVAVNQSEQAVKPGDIKQTGQLENLVCVIELAEVSDKVCVRGFAYLEHVRNNNLSQTYVILQGEKEMICAETIRLYNPTIAPQMESRKNLNFVEFYTVFSPERLHEKQYRIGVEVKPLARRRKIRCMTDVYLRNYGN